MFLHTSCRLCHTPPSPHLSQESRIPGSRPHVQICVFWGGLEGGGVQVGGCGGPRQTFAYCCSPCKPVNFDRRARWRRGGGSERRGQGREVWVKRGGIWTNVRVSGGLPRPRRWKMLPLRGVLWSGTVRGVSHADKNNSPTIMLT